MERTGRPRGSGRHGMPQTSIGPATMTLPSSMATGTGVSDAPGQGPATQNPSSMRNWAPCVAQRSLVLSRVRNWSGVQSSGVRACGQMLTYPKHPVVAAHDEHFETLAAAAEAESLAIPIPEVIEAAEHVPRRGVRWSGCPGSGVDTAHLADALPVTGLDRHDRETGIAHQLELAEFGPRLDVGDADGRPSGARPPRTSHHAEFPSRIRVIRVVLLDDPDDSDDLPVLARMIEEGLVRRSSWLSCCWTPGGCARRPTPPGSP